VVNLCPQTSLLRGERSLGGYPRVCAKSALMTAGDGESCARFVGDGCQTWFPPPMVSCEY
jgi:hypothetical protein